MLNGNDIGPWQDASVSDMEDDDRLEGLADVLARVTTQALAGRVDQGITEIVLADDFSNRLDNEKDPLAGSLRMPAGSVGAAETALSWRKGSETIGTLGTTRGACGRLATDGEQERRSRSPDACRDEPATGLGCTAISVDRTSRLERLDARPDASWRGRMPKPALSMLLEGCGSMTPLPQGNCRDESPDARMGRSTAISRLAEKRVQNRNDWAK